MGLTLLFASLLAAGEPCVVPPEARVQFRKASLFGDVLVVDEGDLRSLRFGSACGSDQSSVSLREPGSVQVEYVRNASVALAYARQTRRVLMVGLGGGVFSNLVARALPKAEIDVVEIDPVVVEVAQRFFGVKPSDRYRIHVDDAAVFVRATQRGPYDVIFLDAYDGDGIPEALASDRFFADVKRLLADGGVVVANLGLDEPAAYLALARRLRALFDDAVCIPGRQEANLVVIAGRRETLRREGLDRRAAELEQALALPLSELAALARSCP